MKTKIFDCVEMKRESQEIIYNEINNMSRTEELNYWNNAENSLQMIMKQKNKTHLSKV